MAITKKWEINTLNRELADGYVTEVIYRVKGMDGEEEKARVTGGGFLEKPEISLMAAESALSGNAPPSFSIVEGLALLGSSPEKNEPVAVDQIEPIATPSLFNVASDVGLDFTWYKDTEIDLKSIPIHESIGGGIGVLDYDLDGAIDLYLAQGNGDPPSLVGTLSNLLYRNLAGQFEEMTAVSGTSDKRYSVGVAAGDWNQDGFDDIVVLERFGIFPRQQVCCEKRGSCSAARNSFYGC